jgi:GNAT superfamily N-acetyltransferase
MSATNDMNIRRSTLAQIINLRHAVLRAGLPLETAIFVGDELPTTRHYAAFTGDAPDRQAIACATYHLSVSEGEPAWQLRGMATAEPYRGRGLGRMLLEFAERELLADPDSPGVLWCNARVPAVGFYQRMGWEIVSETFDIPTAGPHMKMRRLLR